MRIIEKVIQSNLEPARQDVIWVDTSDPSTPVVKTYLNGKWEVTSPSGDGYVSVKSLTKEEYDALGEKDPETLYIVKNGLVYDIYLGEDKIVSNDTNITWTNLVALRNSSMLIPGMRYRIIDYNTTTVQDNTQSAGHQFDIIVTADDNHTINENARAARHAGDTYFTDAKLEAWELKYCIDNDTERFAWAGSNSTGKGVIYYMKDEWSNECPYDFKNIQFKVGANAGAGTVEDVFYYTFSLVTGVGDTTVTDFSLNGAHCYCNKIGVYVYSLKQSLSFNVFRHSGIGLDCRNNTLGDGCRRNTFGSNCYNNTLGKGCCDNTFGYQCYHNMLVGECSYNTIGGQCSYNTFGYSSNSNTFGLGCTRNTFGAYCSSNKFGNHCDYNIFGTFVSYIITGNNMYEIMGTRDYIRYLIVESGVSNVNAYCTGDTSASNYCQNIKIGLGVRGLTADNKLKIDITSQIGATASVTYEPTGSSVINV